MSISPFTECPSFQRCSCNRCPLDYEASIRQVLPSDPQRRCITLRKTRVAIAARHPDLPSGGLTDAEVKRDARRAAARARWEALSPDERAALTAKLQPRRRNTPGFATIDPDFPRV